MALKERHLWCIERIVECFRAVQCSDPSEGGRASNSVTEAAAHTFLRKPLVLERFNALFAGTGGALFVHCRECPKDGGCGGGGFQDRENVDANLLGCSTGGGVRLSLSDGAAPFIDCMPPSTVPSLPESGNAPFPKFCFFFRRGPNVDASVASDTTLLYGEMSSANPLASVRAILGSAYADMFAASVEWGKARREERVELIDEVDRTVAGLVAALDSMGGGLVLRKPTQEQLNLCQVVQPSGGGNSDGERGVFGADIGTIVQQVTEMPEVPSELADLLAEWCDEMEKYVGEGAAGDASQRVHRPTSAMSGKVDVGPRGELKYWRDRMQKLQSAHEQLNLPGCRAVTAFIMALSRSSVASALAESFAVSASPLPSLPNKDVLAGMVRRWRAIYVAVVEAANEAKDNAKYLFSLRSFVEPLYTGTAQNIMDSLPALLNSIKMIHTIARYYNTQENMTMLFVSITDQIIINCKGHISLGGVTNPVLSKRERKAIAKTNKKLNATAKVLDLWDRNSAELIAQLQKCVTLKEIYQQNYHSTKQKLQEDPDGKQFDFNEMRIFGKYELFCRRIKKLIDLFATIRHFTTLAENRLEGMEPLIEKFEHIRDDFRSKDHALLDYHNNRFDRDYVEFSVSIVELEEEFQLFVDKSFELISSIEHSLDLLSKFRSIFHRDNLAKLLDSKLTVIFQNYGLELQQVQQLYEKQKHDPPIAHNMPPVAGSIGWSRHLLKRIEEPMKQFEKHESLLASKDSRRIVKMYNKVARTLVAFEFLWYKAWNQSVDKAKTGLQATLIIRHPDDDNLYVNFDHDIFQLMREAKCLERMQLDIPESARIVLYQEEKFKMYYRQLHWTLTEHDRIVANVIPVTAMILQPHFRDLEYKLRPGMVTLTWTSMNIDAYICHIHGGLRKLKELVGSVRDVIENRIEKNLKILSKMLLLDLPQKSSFTVSDFIAMQQRHILERSAMLQEKNTEIEQAVHDLIKNISSYPFECPSSNIILRDAAKLRDHYNHFVYQALLNSAKNSMNAFKKRIGSRGGGSILNATEPFFEVYVELMPPNVVLSPSLDQIQDCTNKSAQAILSAYKSVLDWGYADLPKDLRSGHNFFSRITKDVELVRVCLLMTGCVQGIRKAVAEYLTSFEKFDWLWQADKDAEYGKFASTSPPPSLDDYEAKLVHFGNVEADVERVKSVHVIGALSLNTSHLKKHLEKECHEWKLTYSRYLHARAKAELETLTEYIRVGMGKLARKVDDLDSLGFLMVLLREVRERESCIEMEIEPVMEMYKMLEDYLPSDFMEKEEIDKKTVLRANWKKLIVQAQARTDELSRTQVGFKQDLLRDISELQDDVVQFRRDFIENGPMVQGLAPLESVDRLSRFKEELQIRERKYELYKTGEKLFALTCQAYPDLERTKKDIRIASQLFDLYVDVIHRIADWKAMPWLSVAANMGEMTETIETFASRYKQLPKKLRDYDSYTSLRKEIDDFQRLLPMLGELVKDSIKARHWEEVCQLCGVQLDVLGNAEFKLETLLEADLLRFSDDIEEITDGADKQLKIEQQLHEIKTQWDTEEFVFQPWKDRGIFILSATPIVMEELEEAQMNLQTMLTMRHIAPFRNLARDLLKTLSEASDTLEQWIKVQLMWCALESVFTGGDIAKQMPREAKKFVRVDKDWAKVMTKASECRNVVGCCSDELLKHSLPHMSSELEKCQKSLEGYLEQKQNAFPRFYFVSNAKLLVILSQGSDPLAMNEYYENVFDAIQYVEHDADDKTIIRKFHGSGGEGHEIVDFVKPVHAIGNIENWLMDLLKNMQQTMKVQARECAEGVAEVQSDLTKLRPLVDRSIAQFALLAVQIMWTFETQTALEQCRTKKNAMKDNYQRQMQVLSEMSTWCLQDLGTKANRKKIETLVTIHVHQRDIAQELMQLHRARKIQDPNDFDWLKQARFYWRPSSSDDVSQDGATVVSITDVDFNYQYEYLGSKERLVVTPLTDKCYITLAQALGMYFGGAPAGPAGTGKTETVKDLGNSLGIFVVVTNCTDQMKYTDCAKIFKGLCQGGLWGCFDEFNRITLPVLSVVAQQVLAIQTAKKQGVTVFQFPGDPQNVTLQKACSFFITMNPGYAGRQELPENLKALFRGVAMMTPDFQIIKKVKMCSVGYSDFDVLSAKFYALYATCKEQLSNQRHYDWGLRNILSVLRTMGATKRENNDKSEAMLVYRTVRDMNLSKLVAQDVPLFLSLLADLFPGMAPPSKGEYLEEEAILRKVVKKHGLIYHENWVRKTIQLFETTRVRHGIMLVGPSGGGKSCIFKCLKETLQERHGIQYKDARFNPKAMRAQEMYGETDPLSGDWTTGVFAAMWAKFNNRNNSYNTWIIADGPVDAIWIEDLNTVLDDNRILTLANGDRIPMTDNVKMMFEVETLVNASPATVSRAGIIYVSDTDLDWGPVFEAWVQKRPNGKWHDILRSLSEKWIGKCTPNGPGDLFEFLSRHTSEVIKEGRVGRITSFTQLFEGLTEGDDSAASAVGSIRGSSLSTNLERFFIYCLCWSIASLLETDDRKKLNDWLIRRDSNNIMPAPKADGDTVFEFYIDPQTCEWKKWTPPAWSCPQDDKLDFSNLLVPTMDSTRALYVIKHIHKQKVPVLIVGAEGTAKTSTQLMFLASQDPTRMLTKRINFSSATTPGMAQYAIEAELDKRGGKNYGPPHGKKMTIFFDDVSMPEVNNWGDQTTLELVRLGVEYGGFCFLDKDKRGDFKTCEDLQYLAAMQHPGSGKNDIPNRLKRNFFIFNLVLPSITSINDIYGQMLCGRFTAATFDGPTLDSVSKLTNATIQLWGAIKAKMLPTPAKFHYVFNMRDLSRIFQGILLTPKESLLTGGLRVREGQLPNFSPQSMLVGLWKHECDRVVRDKLTNDDDKAGYESLISSIGSDVFGDSLYLEACNKRKYMVSFLRDDVYDDEGVLLEEAPKIYEDGGSLDMIRERAYHYLRKYNEEYPSRKMELILFDDALKHLLSILRLIETPRGSGLLVGVGGCGKQSLTRLAAYICRARCFQITLTKQYNVNALMDDIRLLYQSAGHKREPTVFLFTESEIKDEVFLETINSILSTGEVPGLFAKDEMMAMTADLRPDFVRERPDLEETPGNLRQYFIDCVRDNLHIVLCMSPLNPNFPVRARKFPSLVSSPTVDWFLPWPEDALVEVARGIIQNFAVECTNDVKTALMSHMGMVHKMATDVCAEYHSVMRRQVHQTPKSFLSFLAAYKEMYSSKLAFLKEKEGRVKMGLEKLIHGAKDVEAMKVVLAEEKVKLEVATENTNKMLTSLEVSKAEAKKEGEQVAGIKAKCEEDAKRIAKEKASCTNDLAKAQPFVDEANSAIDSIKPAHIGEIKKLANPSDIIKLVFDGVLILFQLPLGSITPCTVTMAKTKIPWFDPSFKQALQMMSNSAFLAQLVDFGKSGKDTMNDETIEFLSVYIDIEQFNPAVAKNASTAAEGLCTYVRAMKFYHEASKIVKPKMEALAIAENQMEAANKALAAAEARLAACNEKLTDLQNMFDSQMAKKKDIEEGARALQKKMNKASALIDGLAGERLRWAEDAANFSEQKTRLVGDCAIACAFVCYCGPFNQQYRDHLIHEKFTADCQARGVPVTKKLDVISFLANVGTIGDWRMQGLPTDPLSTQNGILVTKSSRYPLLVDPQGQALSWILSKEKKNLPSWNGENVVKLTDPKLKEKLEFCMGDGKTLVVVGVEDIIDPMLDPVLEKELIRKGSKYFVNVSDKVMDYDPNFRLYFISRLPNPTLSPELQAKTTLIDFTVTQKGLEEQLLGKVIGKEQRALEEQLTQVLEEVNVNTKSLMHLDASLLERLTSNSGDLLDDDELVSVLAGTKAKAADVNAKLIAADETRSNIAEKREQFRPAATRGSVLYFAIVEMSLVNSMYQTSLDQFLDLFMGSMDRADPATLASKRVANIIDTMTYMTYRYVNRGLYEADKLAFVMLVTMKILIVADKVKGDEMAFLLRGGATLDIGSVRGNSFKWMTNEVWLNIVQLSQQCKFYADLIGKMVANEEAWRRWYEDNQPENKTIPDYEHRLTDEADVGPFLKLLLVRCLRIDRTILMSKEFLRNTKEMGPTYVEPVTDTIESVYDDMCSEVPVIFLLSRGADPTDTIEILCRKKKLPPLAVISLGEGQEVVAKKAINAGVVNGSWVLLQNCELCLELMGELEGIMEKLKGGIDPNFRLFLTALPNVDFPLGLLHMSIKCTNEPPSGLKAGLLRSYTTIVDQDRIERIESEEWRKLLYCLCTMHSVAIERRRFGPLGFNVPYEFSDGDLLSCILFLEKMLYNSGEVNWQTLQYAVSVVFYGGKLTQSMDNRFFQTFASEWLTNSATADKLAFLESGEYRKVIGERPEEDSPLDMGLHSNANLTYQLNEANALFQRLSSTQPKGGGGSSGGASREDAVLKRAAELLGRLPRDYPEDDVRTELRKQGGLSVPLNIFLYQELQRFQAVLGKVRYILEQLRLSIKGEVVMTEELNDTLESLMVGDVPYLFENTVTGDEFSWRLPNVGLWVESLLQRDRQYRGWLEQGRPKAYWLPGFFNPAGLLTSIRQEACRRLNRGEGKVPLDNMVYVNEVLPYERAEQMKQMPEDGILVYGMVLEGSGFERSGCVLTESRPKELHVSLPLMHITAMPRAKAASKKREFGELYSCPVYKYGRRGDSYLVAMADLKVGEATMNHWTMRGVALLLNK